MPGPRPRREGELARPRHRKGADQAPTVRGELRPVRQWDADPEWHPIAINLFDSLAASGQSDFYQESDWAYAYAVCDDLSQYKADPTARGSAQKLTAIYNALERLLITEGDRLRLRVELHAPVVEDAEGPEVAIMAKYQAMKARKAANE